jgi:hypothetical protein
MRLEINAQVPLDRDGRLDTRQLRQCLEAAVYKIPTDLDDVDSMTIKLRDENDNIIGSILLDRGLS